MKKTHIIYSILLIMMLMVDTSCKKWIDTGINVDPNRPSNVEAELRLPTTQAALGYALGGDLGRPTEIWMQHIAGVSRQSAGYDQYVFTETDADNVWQFPLYGGAMVDLDGIIKNPGSKSPAFFKGAAEVLMAYSLGVVSDLWNYVPYSTAFQGTKNIKPTFDPQQDIYADIQKLLDAGITDLQTVTGTVATTGDIMYNGDPKQWIKMAQALKARYYLHLYKMDASNAAQALTALGTGGLASNADDAQVTFGVTETNANPWYQFNEQRGGDIAMGEFFINLLDSMKDPRLPVYALPADTSGKYIGSPPGDPNAGASPMGPYYNSINSPVPFITYVEQKFIEAEAAFYTGDKTRAANAYNDGMKASIDKLGVTGTVYIAANSKTAGTITLKDIMTQKYISMYTQVESFSDWRRTGIPDLKPAKNNSTNNIIPRRFPYPLSERLQNSANLSSAISASGSSKITDRVWWDK
jgi:hypothetical protein